MRVVHEKEVVAFVKQPIGSCVTRTDRRLCGDVFQYSRTSNSTVDDIIQGGLTGVHLCETSCIK